MKEKGQYYVLKEKAVPEVLLKVQILAFALTFIAALSCLSLYVRRLHDLDHGSLMVLLAFIPLISFFFAVYLMFFRGTIGPNSYGPDPLSDGRGIDAW